jgi:competence protein ComEC
MHPSRYFGFLLLIFLVTTCLAIYFPVHFPLLPYLLVASAVLILGFWQIKWIRYFSLFVFVICLALFRTQSFNPVSFDYGKEQALTGVVKDEPKIIGNRQVVILEGKESANFQFSTNQNPIYHIGDGLKITGILKDPLVENEEYKGLYLAQGIKGEMSYPEIEKIQIPVYGITYLRQKLVAIRRKYEEAIAMMLPEPHAGLLAGIILGSRADISTETASALSRTGTTHLIALSGYNITIMASFALILCRGLSRRWAFWLPVFFIISFVLATALSASVIRAAIMGILLLLAGYKGRQPNAPIAILFASAAMVLLNPMILVYDIGFQLSFAAILGIVTFAPFVQPWFSALGPKLSEILAATIAAQLFTWPITSFYFKTFSVIAPLANLLLLPLIPAIMLIGFISATIIILSPSLVVWLRAPMVLMLDFPLRVTRMLSGLKWAAINFQVTSPLIIIGYYFLVFDFFLLLNRKNGKPKRSFI